MIPRGFEPPTCRTGICHSIQLNYGTNTHTKICNHFVFSLIFKTLKQAGSMTKFLFIPFLYLVLANTMFSQPSLQWSRTHNDGNTNGSTDMVLDSLGNTFTVGSSHDTLTTSYNILVIKRDALGDTVWTSTFYFPQFSWPTRIILDHSGNILVCGYASDTGGAAGLLLKFDMNGSLMWSKLITTHSPDSYDAIYEVKCDLADNIYVAGTGGTSMDLIILKISPGGTILWTSFNPPTGSPYKFYSYYTGFDIDDAGNSYLAGLLSTQDSITFTIDNDYALIKFDPAGNMEWISIDTVAGEESYYAEQTNSVICFGNEVYILQPFPGYIPACTTIPSIKFVILNYYDTGVQDWRQDLLYPSSVYNYPKTMDIRGNDIFAGGSTYQNTLTDFDFMILKCDLSGNIQWIKKSDHLSRIDNLFDICSDEGGNVHLTGASFHPTTFQAKSLTISYGISGNVLWTIPGSSTTANAFHSIQIDNNEGDLFLGGAENENFLTVKFSYPLGISESGGKNNRIHLFPNPSRGLFTIETENNEDISEVILYDLCGRVVFHSSVKDSGITLNVSELKEGCYSVRVILSDNSIQHGSLMKTN